MAEESVVKENPRREGFPRGGGGEARMSFMASPGFLGRKNTTELVRDSLCFGAGEKRARTIAADGKSGGSHRTQNQMVTDSCIRGRRGGGRRDFAVVA